MIANLVFKKFRIVNDTYARFEVQCWRLWFPFWIQCHSGNSSTNSHLSIERAKEFIQQKKECGKVVYSE